MPPGLAGYLIWLAVGWKVGGLTNWLTGDLLGWLKYGTETKYYLLVWVAGNRNI